MKPTLSRILPTSLLRIAKILSFGLAAPAISWGTSLDWAVESEHFDAGFETEIITASYPFTNAGTSAVTIIESSASCGCTVPTLDKTTYEPGENGELTAIFTIGSRQGKQRKTITVVTEDANGAKNTYELRLEVDIPVPVTFKPRVRFWKLDSEAITQNIEITFHEQFPIEISGLTRKDPEQPAQFDYEIETVSEGLKYIVKLTPKTPELKARDTFILSSAQDTEGILQKYPIYAYVR